MPPSSQAGSERASSVGSRRPSPGREARLQELLDRERLKDEISKGLQRQAPGALKQGTSKVIAQQASELAAANRIRGHPSERPSSAGQVRHVVNELASHYSRPTTPAGHSRTDGHGHRTSGPSSPHDKIKASRYTASYGAQPARRPGTAGPGPARPGTAGPRPQHAEQPDRQPTPEQTRRPPRPDSAPPQQPPPAAAPPPKPSAPEESTGRFVPVPVYAVAGRPTSLEELIQQKVALKRRGAGMLLQACKRLDSRHDGTLNREGLKSGVGLSPREDHIDALFSRYDRGGGAFDYMSFLKAIVPRAIAENVSFLQTFFDERPKVVRKMAQAPPLLPAALEAVLREKVAARGRNGPVELRTAVRVADADGVGSLTLAQFEGALRQFHLGGTPQDVAALFRSLDAGGGGSGRVPCGMILARILPSDFPDPKEQLKERVANRIAADSESLRDALFAAEGRLGNGRTLSAAAAAEIAAPRLKAAGITGEALAVMAESCVATDSGRLDIDMFVRAASRVATGRANGAIHDDKGNVGLLAQLQQSSYAGPANRLGNGPAAPRFPAAKDLNGLKEVIRASIASRCKPGMREMRLAATYFDPKRSGVASAEELAGALERLNMRLRPEEMDLLMRRYGSRQAGVLRVENLLRDLFPAEWATAERPEAPSGDIAVKVSALGVGGGGLTAAQSVTLDDLRKVCKVCGVNMSDSELLDVMQEARSEDGSVSQDTITRLLQARGNAMRAAAAGAQRPKKRYSSVPLVDHTEMRQEWVPYNGNGVQGGRAYAARFEDDVLFHRAAPKTLYEAAHPEVRPYTAPHVHRPPPLRDDVGWEMPAAVTPTYDGRDVHEARRPVQLQYAEGADGVRWADDARDGGGYGGYPEEDDGYGGYDDGGYADTGRPASRGGHGHAHAHAHAHHRGQLSADELGDIARRDAAERRWAERDREERRARREAEGHWNEPAHVETGDSREQWQEPYGRHMEEGAIVRPGQPDVWVNPRVYGRLRARAKEALAKHYKRSTSAPRTMPSGRVYGQWDPADPLPRPPPPPKAHKQIFSDGWWGPSPKGRPMRAAQAPAAPTPRAPTHFFEGSRGAIHRPDPAQLARLAASAAAERPGSAGPRGGGHVAPSWEEAMWCGYNKNARPATAAPSGRGRPGTAGNGGRTHL